MDKPSVNSSHRVGPTTADLHAIESLFAHPGWRHFQNYLRHTREKAAKRMFYGLDPKENEVEMARSQAEIRLIDKLLADTSEASRVLAGGIFDHADMPLTGPYKESL